MPQTETESILRGLNPEQRQAVETIDRPVLIVAGPGSGKTRVITHRIAYLVRVCGVAPHRIMAVTFTNKAAREMSERLQGLIGERLENVTVGTFHAICVRILRRDGATIGVDPKFLIYDDDDQISLVKSAFKELHIDDKLFAPRSVLSEISRAKSTLVSSEDYRRNTASYFQEVVARVYDAYDKLLQQASALDFDDLILKTVRMLENAPDVRRRLQERYVHIVVDEFQDTNLAQYQLVKLLAGHYRNLCVVGDPDQSIYAFRAADIRNILSFKHDFPDATEITLHRNYRSTQNILDVAQHVIKSNTQRIDKELTSERRGGIPIKLIDAYDERDEGQNVVREIDRLVNTGKVKYRDCAVLYRTNAQSRPIEETLVRYGLPYRLIGGTRFYQRREIKDVLAYLRLVQNPNDTVSLRRIINVPPRDIGAKTVADLEQWAQRMSLPVFTALQVLEAEQDGRTDEVPAPSPFSARARRALLSFQAMLGELIARSEDTDVEDLLRLALDRSGYLEALADGTNEGEERADNIEQLRVKARDYVDLAPREGLARFLEDVALVSDVDQLDTGANAITLITLHAAKGLEFPVVVIAGMEEGTLPHSRSLDDPNQMEEERRLAYVGITRAKDLLILSRASRRMGYGGVDYRQPSRFLDEIPRDLCAGGITGRPASAAAAPTTWKQAQAPTLAANVALPAEGYKAGERVRHDKFGEGIVVNCTPKSGDFEVTVAFVGSAGIKRLMASFAKLDRS